MSRFLFTIFSVLFSTILFAQNEDSVFIRKLADAVLTDGKAYDNLKVLTKTVGGRLSGSPQMYKAEAWGQKTLKDAGADKVWLQECMVPHWVRGGKDEAKFIANKKEETLDILALGNSVGTGPAGITAPVILINSFEELEKRKDEIKGKIVFYNYKFNPKFVQTFRSYGDAVRYREFGASRAAKYGAVAMLVRSMTHSVDNNPHTGALDYIDSFPKIPAAAVGLWDADKLAKTIQDNKEVKLFLRTNAKMLPDTVGHNVIGELTGSEFPDQYITVGGHLDSWDPAEGANDDGTGCVHSIEVLQALKEIGYKPKHTIRVVLFANEENGLRGGTKYGEEAKAKNEKHIFGLESDAGGFTPRGFSIGLPPEKMQHIREWLPLFKEYGVSDFVQGGGGADVGPLGELLGVPVAELMPDSQRYFDYHHSRNDILANVNKRELELGALNMAILIYLVDKYGLN
ncbi:MAG: M20/M25/M40 family metallo-hydrolase [Bacteroidetes bacterium]|nr:M20/M25/M40 family metallo-hydrolase [Bacteroidota bacterium]